MKKKQLQLYSGKLSELTTPATPEQIALGITNELVDHEPFVMADASEIENLLPYGIPNDYPVTRLHLDGEDMFTVKEFKQFSKLAIGVEIIPSTTTSANAGSPTWLPSRFSWGSTSNNLTFTLAHSTGYVDGGTMFTNQNVISVSNTTPASSGNLTHGYINVMYDGVLIDIIPRNTSRTYVYAKHFNSVNTSSSPLLDRNLYTKVESYTTASNYVLDPSIALVYALNYNISTPSTITIQTSNLSMSFETFTVLMKNTNATNKLTLAVPAGDFAEARTFEINAGKYREASIVRRNGDIVWEVSGELSNA